MGERANQLSRRELLSRVVTLLGAASVSPVLVSAAMAEVDKPASAAPRFLSADQLRLGETLVEMILPATDTPGASAAGVHWFIDGLLHGYFSRTHRDSFMAGLASIDAAAREQGFDSFVTATEEARLNLLRTLDNPQRDAQAERAGGRWVLEASDAGDGAGSRFFLELKGLTLLGYYTSEIGASQELAYQPIPGAYDGCVPYEKLGRAWATS